MKLIAYQRKLFGVRSLKVRSMMHATVHLFSSRSSRLTWKTRFLHVIQFLCWDDYNWFQNNPNDLFLVLEKMCILTAESKSAAYYANVIFTKAITMVSSSKSFIALRLGQ